jgi:hypothetical protein
VAKIYSDPITGEYFEKKGGEYFPINPAAAESSAFESAVVGLGSGLRDIGENLGMAGPRSPGDEQAMTDLRTAHPVATRAGEWSPGFVPGIRAGQVAKTIGGGVLNTITGDPNQSMPMRFAVGAAGEWGGDMIGRIMGRLKSTDATQEATTELAEQFRQSGGNLTPGQASGDLQTQLMEQSLSKKPGAVGVFEKGAAKNQANTNRLFLDSIGLGGTTHKKLTDNARAEAEAIHSNAFRQVAREIEPQRLSEGLSNDIRDLIGHQEWRERVWQRSTGTSFPKEGSIEITGDGLQKLRSKVSKKTISADDDKQDLAIDLIEQIDDIIEAASSRSNKELYKQTRDQWRMLNRIDRAGALTSGGDVNPTSAFGKLRAWTDSTGPQKTFRQNVQGGGDPSINAQYPNPARGSPTGVLNQGIAEWAKMPLNYAAAKGHLGTPGGLINLGAGADPWGQLGGTFGRGLLSGATGE